MPTNAAEKSALVVGVGDREGVGAIAENYWRLHRQPRSAWASVLRTFGSMGVHAFRRRRA